MSKTFEVKITARNFTFGSKVFGTNGTYTVDDKTARWIVNNGKGFVTKGILPPDQDEATGSINDAAFMAMIRRNAGPILELLEKAAKDLRDKEMSDEADEVETKDDGGNSEGPTTDQSDSSLSQSPTNEAMNASDAETDIPEDFPGREVLIKAGITKVSEVPTDKEGLMAIEGMSDRLAKQIGVKQTNA